MTVFPPLRREVLVDADRELAFAVFTQQIGGWWPLGEFSVHGAGATVAFDPARASAAGSWSPSTGADDATWGTVTRWEPVEAKVAFTWHPGHGPDQRQQGSRWHLRRNQDGKTLVRLGAHRLGGSSATPRPQVARAEYDQGWPVVLGRLRRSGSPPRERIFFTWVALVHTPRPTRPWRAPSSPTRGSRTTSRSWDGWPRRGTSSRPATFATVPVKGMAVLRLPG